jgi:pimeloyl-ACP methyl ester carboxylesterase
MNVNFVYPPRLARRGRVIALHCSGSGASQWRYLSEAFGGRYQLVSPEHYGCESAGAWSGEHAFTLADEAARTIGLIDQLDGEVHLVGHSYGGGVALHVALARTDRIASLALYEPSAFHLLRELEETREAFAEISGIARSISNGVVIGDHRGAMTTFVDYWNGRGAFAALRPSLQDALIRWAPKAPLDFNALIGERTPVHAYANLELPVLIMRGEHAPLPTRVIAERLAVLLPASRTVTIEGAGHMGPITHAPEVSALIVRHVETYHRNPVQSSVGRQVALTELQMAEAGP